ncbi:MAG: hypothetical protein RLY93_07455 [Sumerlaeia bacterium]
MQENDEDRPLTEEELQALHSLEETLKEIDADCKMERRSWILTFHCLSMPVLAIMTLILSKYAFDRTTELLRLFGVSTAIMTGLAVFLRSWGLARGEYPPNNPKDKKWDILIYSAFFGVVGGGLAIGPVAYINARWDRSKGEVYELLVLDYANGEDRDWAEVPHWKDERKTKSIWIPKRIYEALEEGDTTLKIRVTRGILGVEYMAAMGSFGRAEDEASPEEDTSLVSPGGSSSN